MGAQCDKNVPEIWHKTASGYENLQTIISLAGLWCGFAPTVDLRN